MTTLDAPDRTGTGDGGRFTLDPGGWLRLIGGMLLGSGALVLLFREGAGWDDWARFATFAIAAVILLGIAMPVRTVRASGWQSAFFLFGTFLMLFAFFQFVQAVEGNVNDELNIAWCFGVAGAFAVLTSFVRGAKYQMLIGSAFLVVTWMALWSKILDDGQGDTFRVLLIVIAAIYLGLAYLLGRRGRAQASDLVTVGGAAAVFAGALSFGAVLKLSPVGGSFPGEIPEASEGWNVYLLVISLVLIGYGSRSVTRGPAYIGAFGLITFIYLVGLDLVSRIGGDKPGDEMGWPLILLIAGGVALVASFFLRPRRPDDDGRAVGPAGGGGGPLGAAAGVGGGVVPGASAGQPTTPGYPQQGLPGAGQPTTPGYPQQGLPGAGQPTTPGSPPPPPPAAPGQPEDSAGGLLDQWRREPPPGSGGQ